MVTVKPICLLSERCTFSSLEGVDPPITTVFQMAKEQPPNTQSLAESVELDALVEKHKAMHKLSLKGMIPPKGNVQNAQRSFASLGSKGQSSTYA